MAIFMPQYVIPDVRSGLGLGVVDATKDMTVAWKITGNSALTSFSITIYTNDSASTQKYTTGQITTGCPAYGTASDGTPQMFTYTIQAAALSGAGITNGNEYKLVIKQWWSANDSVTQASASVFETRAAPILSLNPLVTATDITADITPVQDLHGYDKPWAGGAGKNKLQVTASSTTINGVTFTVNSDGSVFVAGGQTASANANLYVAGDSVMSFGDDILTGCPANGSNTTYRMEFRDVTDSASVYDYGTGTKIDASTNGHTCRVVVAIRNGYTTPTDGLTFYPMIRADGTSATWEPYANECPITGWTGVNLSQSNQNLLSTPYFSSSGTINNVQFTVNADYSVSISGVASSPAVFILKDSMYLPAGTYYTPGPGVAGAQIVLRSGNYSGSGVYWFNNAKVFTIAKGQYFGVVLRVEAGNAAVGTSYPLIAWSSSEVSYVPGALTVTPISWQSEAGTIYGGSIDIGSGDLTETWANIASYAGETLPGEWLSSLDEYTPGGVPTTGAQVVYELASPNTYTISSTAIQTINGDNVIFADTGNVTVDVVTSGVTKTLTGVVVSFGSNDIFTRYATFTGAYSQAQGDTLNWFRWRIAYADDTASPFFDTGNISGTMDISCYYDGFLGGTEYAVRLTAQTENGIEADTGWVLFTADYNTSFVSGGIDVSCAAGTDAVRLQWSGIGYIPGISVGSYTISDDNILTLPSGSSVSWNTAGTGAMDFAAPWSLVWQGTFGTAEDATIFTVGQSGGDLSLVYTYSTQRISLQKGGSTLVYQAGSFNSAEITVVLTDIGLYIRSVSPSGGLYPNSSLYPDNALYPQTDEAPEANIYLLMPVYTQEPIISASVGGSQHCSFFEIIEGVADAAVIDAAINEGTYDPGISGGDYLLADWTDGIDAGNLNVGDDTIIGFTVYRRQGDNDDLVKIAETSAGTTQLYDYSAASQQGPYTYYLFPTGEKAYITQPVVSNPISPCWWNWTLMECAETEDDNAFTVLAAYRFRYNIETGAISNNNEPAILANFTPYPKIQLVPQNYKSATLTGLIGGVSWAGGQPEYIDTISLRDAIYALSVTPHPLFLKSRKGDLFRVRISGNISMQTNDASLEQMQTMTLPWVETGPAKRISLYSYQSAAQPGQEN